MNNVNNLQAMPKRDYSKPRLEKLGLVKVMTQSGSQGASESAGQNNDMACLPEFNTNTNCLTP